MKVSVVIPAYNEEENLPVLFERLVQFLKHQDGWELVLINDHSTDKTAEIVDEYAKSHHNVVAVHRNDGRPGMGNALIEGTKKASGEVVIWSMADLSDDPNIYPVMVEKIKDGCDMVLGSRYIPGGSRGDLAAHKAFFSSFYSKVAHIIFGLPVNDITNAFRAFRKEVFNLAMPESGDFAISPEFVIKAHLRGFRLCEVPTTYKSRVAGKTSFKMFKMAVRYGLLFRYLFTYDRKRPSVV